MSSTNVCHFFGRLVAVPEVQYYTTGTKLTQFGLAVDNFSKKADLIQKGRGAEYTPDFIDCKLWGDSGENLSRYATQGQQLYIQAESVQERWKDKATGTNRSRITYRIISWQLGRETDAVLKQKYGAPAQAPAQAKVPKKQQLPPTEQPAVAPQAQPQAEMAGVGDLPY